jgi:hypothetical protein
MSKNDVDFLRVACTFAARSKRGVRTEMQQCRGWISMEVMSKNDTQIGFPIMVHFSCSQFIIQRANLSQNDDWSLFQTAWTEVTSGS